MSIIRNNLSALINHCVRLMEKGNHLDLKETESAIIDERVVQFLQDKFGDSFDLTVFSKEMAEYSIWWDEVNQELKGWAITEYIQDQPGKSARKWGISKDGLAYIIALSADLLTEDN